jgi:hypothetical protein
MNPHMINFLAFLCAGQDSTPGVKEVPTPEITQRRANELSEGFKNVQKLSNYLKSIGDIGKRQPGETESQFLQRVENGTKAQALLLIDLRNEYEKLLQNRYELELLTVDYKKWLENKDIERLKSIEADKAALSGFDDEVKIEAAAMILIGRKVEEYLKSAPKSVRDKIEDLDENILRFKGYSDYPDSKIRDILAKSSVKFKDKINKDDLITPEVANKMIKYHQSLSDAVVEKKNEMKILTERILAQQNMKPMEDFDQARVKAIANGKKILEETRKLESQAHSVALLSKYVRFNLISLNTPGRNAQFRIDEFQTRLNSNAIQLEQYLGVLTNSADQEKKSSKALLDDVFK